MTNFRRTWKKGNKRGASLIYAMLIMLVCTVIASVVLTAATAAAGRIVKTSETDRRYFSVNSTVAMIKELLSEAEYNFQWTYQESRNGYTQVTVDYMKNSDFTESIESTTTKLSELLMEYRDEEGSMWMAAKYGTRNLESLSDIFLNASLDLLLGTERTNGDEFGITGDFKLADAWNSQILVNDGESGQGHSSFVPGVAKNELLLTMEGANRKDVSNVKIKTELDVGGTLTVLVVAGDKDVVGRSGDDVGYAVKLIFRPDINDKTYITNRGDIKVGNPEEFSDELGRMVTRQPIKRVSTYTRDVSYHWNLDSVITLDLSKD